MRKSKGTLNLARTQAARADVDTFDLTVNNSADTLDVRLPGTFRLQVGVADVVAGQLAFCTKLANICHVLHLLHTQGHSGPQTQYKYSTTNEETMQVFLLDNMPQAIIASEKYARRLRCASSGVSKSSLRNDSAS